MNYPSDNKPSLPSIKDLLEGGPGLIDYSPTSTTSKTIHSHRRHASEHIPSINQHRYEQAPTNVIPPIPNVASSLPFDMQSLSLEKRKAVNKLPSSRHDHSFHNTKGSSLSTPSLSRRRTHSRSFSDFTHPYPHKSNADSLTSPPLSLKNEDTKISVSPTIISEDEEEDIDERVIGEGTQSTIVGGKYICSYCEKGFTRPSSLRTHTYSHTGEKPFKCTEPGCGRKFSVQSNLRRHLRIHRTNRTNTLFITNNIKQ